MKANFYISFGIWLAIIPMLGIPGVWKNWMMGISGLFLVIISLGPILAKRLQTKGRPRKKIIAKPDSLETEATIEHVESQELRFTEQEQKIEEKHEI